MARPTKQQQEEKRNIKLNLFYEPNLKKPGAHEKQKEVLEAIDDGKRWVQLRCGRKFGKTKLLIGWLFEQALKTKLTCVYIAPSKVQAKNITWDDHIQKLLTHFKQAGLPYKTNENELSVSLPVIENGKVTFKGGGKVQLFGVENGDSLRGLSNWGGCACFPAGTMVLTGSGEKPIESITPGTKVVTPHGFCRVLRSGIRKTTTSLTQITLNTGETIRATGDHKVFTENGLVSFNELDYDTPIWTKTHHRLLSSKGLSLGVKKASKSITAQEPANKHDTFTEKYGSIITVPLRQGGLYITRMVTPSIIPSKTSSALPLKNIQAITQSTVLGKTLKHTLKGLKNRFHSLLAMPDQKQGELEQKNTLKQLDHWRANGMDQKREGSGTHNEDSRTGGFGKQLQNDVERVTENMRRIIQNDHYSAPHIVEISHIELANEIPVYDLTVEYDHAYFANSLLVSNCDEYDDWEDDIWPLIIRPNLAPHMAPAIIAGTPKGFGNLYRNEQSGLFTCFHFTSYDNPTLDPQELMDLEIEYKSMGMGYYRQEILAEYERPQGTVYEEWSTNNFKPVPYDPFLPLHLSIDFGVNDPTAIIWIQPNGNEFRIVDYYEASDGNVDHFVQVIRSKPYKKPDLVTGDAAGKARSITTNTAPIDEYAKHGIHVRTKDGLKIPDQIRITHKYIPSLYIDDKRGERLRDCILNYRYPTKPNSALNQSNEIPLHNEWSHGLRALEYYFANIDGSGLLNNQGRNISFHNKSLKKKWGIG